MARSYPKIRSDFVRKFHNAGFKIIKSDFVKYILDERGLDMEINLIDI